MLLLFALAAVLGFILCAPLAARADSIQLTFSIPAPFAPPAGTPPWGLLDLTLNPDKSISADFLVAAGQGFSTPVLCFNVAGSVAGFSVSGLPGGWSGEAFPSGETACSAASFGNFNAYVGGDTNQTELDFIISRTGGFSSVYNLMAPSLDGSPSVDWMTEIYQGDLIGNAGAGGSPTPEPSTFLMLGSGILGVFGMLRRKLL